MTCPYRHSREPWIGFRDRPALRLGKTFCKSVEETVDSIDSKKAWNPQINRESKYKSSNKFLFGYPWLRLVL
jgi:hypothetical protein